MSHAFRIVASNPGGVDVLREQAFEPVAPAAGEILIRQTAVGVNFIDVYFRTGLYPWPVDEDLVLGSEAAGTVEAIGEGVDNFSVGDRVAYTVANGAYSTHRTIPTGQVVHVPDDVSDTDAAASTLKGLTARYLLHDSFKVRSGHTVLFHAAAGGVGLIAGQWLKAKGATVIGTAGGPAKCALAAENGYEHVVDYRSEDFVERVAELTGGAGVDVVYDSVGNDTVPGSLKCLKTHGTLVSFGQSSGPVEGFKITDLAAGSFHLTRPTLFHFAADRTWLENAAGELFSMIGSGTLKISVNQTFPLKQAATAHEELEARKTTGCTVLVP